MAFDYLEKQLRQTADQSRQRRLNLMTIEGTFISSDDGRRFVNFGGNDYLGVVADQTSRTTRVSDPYTPTVPSGASASSLVCGWTSHHADLADQIARLERTEAAVVFPSGYAACSGTIATLGGPRDLILSDVLNHASLIDGCRAAKATKLIYPHLDCDFIRDALSARRGEFESVWIVTDGVFSMDGDAAPIPDLVEIADRYDCSLIVDEAHGTGVLGDSGGGLCEAMEMRDRVAIRIGTLSKAIGHQGGFVAGPKVVIDYLIQFSRPLIYSTALSPIVAAGAADVIRSFPNWQDRRNRIADLSRMFRERINICLPSSAVPNLSRLESGIPIVPVIIGSDQDAVSLSKRLGDAGFFVPAIRPPTVPDGTARLRVSITAVHQPEQLRDLADAIKHSFV